ncbi:MAG: ribonuclease HII [Bdellovibrionales bacterium]
MPSHLYERQHGAHLGKIVCGVDEVGRGPLAGPVMAAAVILPAKFPGGIKNEIRDSKKMSPQAREDLFVPLTQLCRYAIAEANVKEISRYNILWASMLAMKRAIDGLKLTVDMALVDGNRIPPQLACPAVAIVGGDDKCLSIAVASIIAKVTRDRLMKKLAQEHPGYGWENNCGYATPEHLAALQRLGPTIWHRDSFAPVAQLSLLTG